MTAESLEPYEDFYRSDSERLVIEFCFLAYLCSVARNAERLLDAVLDHEPMAEIVKELSRDLFELDMHMAVIGTLVELNQDFLESHFVRAEIKHRDIGSPVLSLWSSVDEQET